MRIIAGTHRGRHILPPANAATRPITDRVKQSLFDVLSPRIEGANVLDLFAGTGSMGLESLSRGAARATFFEADRSAVKLLRQNIDALSVARCSKVISLDLFKWFERSAGQLPLEADVIFLDPPYRFLSERSEDLSRLAAQLAEGHLRPDGIVIFRHDSADVLELPALRRYDQRAYGSMMLEFLTAPAAP